MRFLVVLMILGITACNKDFLEPKDSSSLNRQTYINSLGTMEQFVKGIQLTVDRDFQRSLAVVYGDLTADNLKPGNTLNTSLLLHYGWSQRASESSEDWLSSESTAMNGEWKNSYQNIRSCNFVIEDVDKYRNENPAKSDNLKGQALALRAMIHMKLLNFFCQTYTYSNNASHIGIPYITTSDITASFERIKVAEVYDKVIKDLKDAISLMPAGIPSARYMNQTAAKALLARIYLFKGDYSNAKTTAEEIITQVPLMSIAEGYPDRLYYKAEPGTPEVLYQLTPAFTTSPITLVTVFAGAAFRGSNPTFRPTDDIISLLSENSNDVRNKWVLISGGKHLVNKYPTGVAQIHLSKPSDYYHTVLRSSEMFLTAAEAALQLNQEDEARKYLNALRQRADPTAPDLNATGEALRDSLYKERRKELAFEGGRMFDLQRWHLPVLRADVPSGTTAVSLPFPSNKAIAPIPIQDVKLEGIKQNIDY